MKNNHGQALIEYLLIVAVISVIAIGIVKLLGGYIKDSTIKSYCELLGKNYVEGEKPGEAKCED